MITEDLVRLKLSGGRVVHRLAPAFPLTLTLALCGALALVPRSGRAQAPAEPPPAWALEVPGAADARWGIGLDYATSETGGFEVQRLDAVLEAPGVDDLTLDPAEVLDLDVDLDRVGVQIPISLGSFGAGAGRAYPFLVLEGGSADATFSSRLESVDERGEPLPRRSLDGDGEYYGATLGLAAALGARQDWFAEGRARYLDVPSFDVSGRFLTGEPAIFGDGFVFQEGAAEEPEGELSSARWLLSARFGRSLFGGRVAPYLGVRSVSHELDLEMVESFQGFQDETATVGSQLEADDDVVSGLAGLDVRLGRRFFVRAEGTFGDDTTGLVKVVRLFGGGRAPRPEGETPSPPTSVEAPDGLSDPPERARQVAERLAPRLRDAVDALEASRRALEVVPGPAGARSYRAADLDGLLVEADVRLAEALRKAAGGRGDLAPLGDYFERRVDRTREDLSCSRCGTGAVSADRRRGPGSSLDPVALLAALSPARRGRLAGSAEPVRRLRPAQQQGGETVPKAEADGVLDRLFSAMRGVLARAERNDLTVDLCIRVAPGSANVRLCPYLNSGDPGACRSDTVRDGLEVSKILGLYAFGVEAPGGRARVQCDPKGPHDPPCPLDLVEDPKPILDCDLEEDAPSCARLDGAPSPCP